MMKMIRATKCKLKQMGPKYLSVSFSLSHLCQASDLALLLNKESVTIFDSLPGRQDKRLMGNGEKLTYSCPAGCN